MARIIPLSDLQVQDWIGYIETAQEAKAKADLVNQLAAATASAAEAYGLATRSALGIGRDVQCRFDPSNKALIVMEEDPAETPEQPAGEEDGKEPLPFPLQQGAASEGASS